MVRPSDEKEELVEYHTALADGFEPDNDPCQSFDSNLGKAFVHNLEMGIPDIYKDADVLYADPPWRHGMEIFYERAGAKQVLRYPDLMKLLGNEIRRIGVPTAITTGKQGLGYLEPEYAIPVYLRGGLCWLALWGIDDLPPNQTSVQILQILAKRYNVVGDFACGNGLAGKLFVREGGKFIMSDINPHCIGYIRDNSESWKNGANA